MIFEPTPDERWDLDAALELVRERLETIVAEYFGEDDEVKVAKRVADYDDVMRSVRNSLRELRRKRR